VRLTDAGATVCGFGLTMVTVAFAEPPGPVAVTVATPPAGMTAGAVYNPAPLIVPEVAVQLAAPADVNCCVAPKFNETLAGAMVWAGGGPLATNGAVNPGPQSEPGFMTAKTTGCAGPWYPLVLSVVALTKVVVRLIPPAETIAPFWNEVPVRVIE